MSTMEIPEMPLFPTPVLAPKVIKQSSIMSKSSLTPSHLSSYECPPCPPCSTSKGRSSRRSHKSSSTFLLLFISAIFLSVGIWLASTVKNYAPGGSTPDAKQFTTVLTVSIFMIAIGGFLLALYGFNTNSLLN